MAVSKASALRLASDAKREGALVLRGRVQRAEDGSLQIDDRDLLSMLGEAEGAEAVIIVAVLEHHERIGTRVCRVCGREYTGDECPHCAMARQRLRGA
jgi:rubrerythrin